MTPLDKLEKVATKARADESRAAKALRASRERHAADSAQLEQLRQFKAEYETRLVEMARDGIDPRQLEDYRRFLASLNEAISRQDTAVGVSGESLSSDRQRWLQTALHSSGLADFIARRRVEARQRVDRQAQRVADEVLASRGSSAETDPD